MRVSTVAAFGLEHADVEFSPEEYGHRDFKRALIEKEIDIGERQPEIQEATVREKGLQDRPSD